MYRVSATTTLKREKNLAIRNVLKLRDIVCTYVDKSEVFFFLR